MERAIFYSMYCIKWNIYKQIRVPSWAFAYLIFNGRVTGSNINNIKEPPLQKETLSRLDSDGAPIVFRDTTFTNRILLMCCMFLELYYEYVIPNKY